MNIYTKLMNIQKELKAPKGQTNTFGKYNYRSCEDILEGVKPLLSENKTILLLNDEVININDRYYIKATAKLVDIEEGESVEVSALAREAIEKKGMDLAQVTGSVSSYARKYALNGLFCIDDTKDADAMDPNAPNKPKPMNNKNTNASIQNKIIISDAQRTRMFTLAKGKDTQSIKNVIAKYGYDSSKKIEVKNYKKICEEVAKL